MPLVPASQVKRRAVDRLWRFAKGYLSLLDGDPSFGKSLTTLDLCARLSTNRPFPDGAPGIGEVPSIVLSAEEGDDDIVCPRLQALGANMDLVHVWQYKPGEALPQFPSQAQWLDDKLTTTGAKFVSLDPIFSLLDARVMVASDIQVRHALQPLAELARKHQCVMQMSRHLNKGRGGRALYRGLYSIAFNAQCRTTSLVAKDPETPGQFVLAQVKNNLDPPQPSLAYRIEKGPDGYPRVLWLGQSKWTEDDLVRGIARESPQRTKACEFLATYLADAPRSSADIRATGRRQGLSWNTLRRARRQMDIDVRIVFPFTPNQKRYWLLPGQQLPAELKDPNEIDLEPWFRPLREQCGK